MSSSKNKIFQTTSFLSGMNSSYIDDLYEKYVKDPQSIEESWRDFFFGLAEKKELIQKEKDGASWSPQKLRNKHNEDLDSYEKLLPKINVTEVQNEIIKEAPKIVKKESTEDVETATKDSVRAIMMIRAFRIRGHLIADLDPLKLFENKDHPELNPETYGFTKKDNNKKIFLDNVLGLKYATIDEILEILKRTYCSKVGVEFMHMEDPEEKSWIQERIEGKEKEISFTSEGKKPC